MDSYKGFAVNGDIDNVMQIIIKVVTCFERTKSQLGGLTDGRQRDDKKY